MATDYLSVNFANGQGDWTIDNKELDGISYVWKADDNGYMKASAYVSGTAHAVESWLISPAFDLSEATAVQLAINHAVNKGSKAVLAVKASADGTNWSDVTLSAWPAGTDWKFIDATADLAAFAGEASVKLAFVYASTTSDCPTWEIKTVVVNDGGEVVPPAEKLDTISTAEALAYAKTLQEPTESGKTTYGKKYVVKGYAVSVYDKNSDGSWSFYMADEADAYGEFMASNTTTDRDVVKGDYMYVAGQIAVYKTKGGNIQYQIYKGQGTHRDAQGIENIELTKKAQKVMVDGVVYIVRDGKMFNALGVQVR